MRGPGMSRGLDFTTSQGVLMLFYDVAQQYLEQDRENLAPLTIRTYYWNLRKLQYYRPDLDCAGVDEEFVRGFRNHLQQRGDKPATVNKALSVFRIFTNKMMADGLVEGKPFEKIKVGRVYTRRGFLTVRELKSLYLNFLIGKSASRCTRRGIRSMFQSQCRPGYCCQKSWKKVTCFAWLKIPISIAPCEVPPRSWAITSISTAIWPGIPSPPPALLWESPCQLPANYWVIVI